MPKPKWNLNIVYISERLQESLRPISRCAMTTVVAPMGYGKTTAVNWYLEERAKAETLKMIRISVYSDNLAIFWKSVQEAFARAGFDILRDYPCPTDATGCGLLADDLCHELAGDVPCFLFIDDFHLLTDARIPGFLCRLANRLPENVHLIDMCGSGYAIPSPEGNAAIHMMAENEGLFLDPVYTGKAFADLVKMAREGQFKPTDNVLYLYSGGAGGLFAIDIELD